MIRHKATTILIDATEETTVSQLKVTLEGITKTPADDQQLYKMDTKQPLEEGSSLGDCGYRSSTAKAQEPATIGLRFKIGMIQRIELVCPVKQENICFSTVKS